MSHLLTKPFRGGRAAIATAPNIMALAVQGILFINPPSFSMSLVPVPCRTLPAAKNIRSLHEGMIPDVQQASRRAQHGHKLESTS